MSVTDRSQHQSAILLVVLLIACTVVFLWWQFPAPSGRAMIGSIGEIVQKGESSDSGYYFLERSQSSSDIPDDHRVVGLLLVRRNNNDRSRKVCVLVAAYPSTPPATISNMYGLDARYWKNVILDTAAILRKKGDSRGAKQLESYAKLPVLSYDDKEAVAKLAD